MVFLKCLCRVSTTGIIIEIHNDKNNIPDKITVEYPGPNGTDYWGNGYTITEKIKYKPQRMKVAGYGVGMHKVPKIDDLSYNKTVHVKYDPFNPRRAYIVENSFWED